SAKTERTAAKNRDRFEDIVLLAPVQIIGGRHGKAFETRKRRGRRDVKDSDHVVRLGIWKRPQEHGVHDAENRAVRADPEGENGKCGESKAGILAKDPNCMADGLKKVVHFSISERWLIGRTAGARANAYLSVTYERAPAGGCPGLGRRVRERDVLLR